MKPGWYLIGATSGKSHEDIVRQALANNAVAFKAWCMNMDESNELHFPLAYSNVVYAYHNGKRFTQYLFATGAMVKDGVEGTALAVFDIPEKEESVE